MEELFNIHIFFFPQILVSAFILVLGLLIFLQNPKSALHRAFLCFEIPVSIWIVSFSLNYFVHDYYLSLLFAKIGFLGVLFVPVATYTFSVFYADDKRQLPIVYAGIFVTAYLALFLDNPHFIAGLYDYPWGYYIALGPLSYCGLGLYAFFIPLFIRNFYLKYLSSPPKDKPWHLAALVSGSLGYLGAIDFFPAYGISLGIPPFGFIFVSVFITLLGYFILRHRLGDLKIILGRGAGYAVLTVFLLFIYASIFVMFLPSGLRWLDLAWQFLLFVILLHLLSFLKNKSQILIDRIFFKEEADYQSAISQFTRDLRNLATPEILLKGLFHFLENTLKIERSYLYEYRPLEKRYIIFDNQSSFARADAKEARLSKRLNDYFSQQSNLVDARDLAFASMDDFIKTKIRGIMGEVGGKIMMPLVRGGELLGFIILGEKLSGEQYTQREITAFQSIATPFSIAWSNAKLFENLQNLSRAKSDFVSIASHQVGTPLTYLHWAHEVLRKEEFGPLNPDQKKMVEAMHSSTAILIETVTELLDLVRIEEKKAAAELDEIDFKALLLDVISQKRRALEEKDIRFEHFLQTGLPKVRTHAQYTRTVISILFDNAIRYTPSGQKLIARAEVAGKKQVVFSLQDFGIGIPEREQSSIFSKFFRASNAQALEPNGSGLGLYYAKTLLERMGGDIWFRSKPSAGTTFFVALPTAKSDKLMPPVL